MLVMILKVLALSVFNDIAIGRLNFILVAAVNLLVFLALIALAVNVMREYIKIYRREHTHLMALFGDFKTNFDRKLGGMMWMFLWVMVWALISIPVIVLAVYLFRRTGRGMRLLAIVLIGPVHLIALIPAIVKGLEYAMTTFILADRPDVTAREALKRSMRLMAGNKKKLFVLVLSFIGWFVLSVLTLGILYVVYVGPYYYTTLAGFYEEVRVKALTDGNGPPKALTGTVIEVGTEADTVCVDEAAAIEAQAEIDALDAIDGGNVEVEIKEIEA